jgi:hypothetical protein
MIKRTMQFSAEEMKSLTEEVLKGAQRGMDEESIKAGVALLVEIETTRVLLNMLQTQQLRGRVTESGKAVFWICDGERQETNRSQKLA